MYVEAIVCNIRVVFLRHSVVVFYFFAVSLRTVSKSELDVKMATFRKNKYKQ